MLGGRWTPIAPTNLTVLRHYRREWLTGDVVAGVTVAAYLIPQVMAYGSLAGLQPVAGLWAMLPCFVIYALIGTSRQLSVGPESTTALMTATTIGALAAGSSERYAELAALLALVLGAYCVLAWLFRLGFVADLLSHPVLVGYLAGLAVIMVIGQLTEITGIPVDGDSTAAEIRSFFENLDQFELAPFLVAATTFALLMLTRHINRVPWPLVAVLAATAVVAAFDLEKHGVALAGALPSGFPTPGMPSTDDIRDLLFPAFGLLVVAYADTILTARSFATKGGYEVDPNHEFLALGASNFGAGFLQGFPVSSSASRTALATSSGGRTQVYSLAGLAAVVIALVFGKSLLAKFPVPALGGLIVYAAFRLVDVGELRRFAAFRKRELVLALATTAGVLVFDILYGVLLAVGLSVAEMLWRVARPHDAILGRVPGLAGMHDLDDYPEAKEIPGLVVYRYDSPLFFANADDFRRRARAAVERHEHDVRWFVLNVEGNVEVDITALDALEELRSDLVERGIVFALARVKQDLLVELEAYGIAERIGADHLFPTLPTAVEAYEAEQSG